MGVSGPGPIATSIRFRRPPIPSQFRTRICCFPEILQRSGADLIISDHLHRVVVPNYFSGDKRPALVSPEGAPLDPKFIHALTGHVQYAQAAGTAAALKVVGHVVKMTGSASIVRNGVTIDVNNGDVIYQNDVVQTGSGSTLGLVMIDGTTFNLTANARLMMNDLTYDATSTSNTSLFTLVQGAANFVAGQVAKTGDMKVSTPVATMGIRGTAVILDFSAIDGVVTVSVVDQRDGQIHALQVYNPRGDLIATVVSNGSVLTLRPTATLRGDCPGKQQDRRAGLDGVQRFSAAVEHLRDRQAAVSEYALSHRRQAGRQHPATSHQICRQHDQSDRFDQHQIQCGDRWRQRCQRRRGDRRRLQANRRNNGPHNNQGCLQVRRWAGSVRGSCRHVDPLRRDAFAGFPHFIGTGRPFRPCR